MSNLQLQSNRYSTVVPTAILESGLCVSVPFYLSPSTEQKKAVLNAFRTIKTQQLIDLGYSQRHNTGSLVVETAQTPPQTQIELDLGMTEDNLRTALFSRQGIQERLVLKLQKLTGIQLVTRKDVEDTYRLWLDHLFTDENKGPTKPAKATDSRNKAKAASKSAE